MSPIESIRERLGVTQKALADGIGCTQSNIGHYSRGQTMPPEKAWRLIAFAKERGQVVTLEEIYPPEVSEQACRPVLPAPSPATEGA